jgi:hypothetical protein
MANSCILDANIIYRSVRSTCSADNTASYHTILSPEYVLSLMWSMFHHWNHEIKKLICILLKLYYWCITAEFLRKQLHGMGVGVARALRPKNGFSNKSSHKALRLSICQVTNVPLTCSAISWRFLAVWVLLKRTWNVLSKNVNTETEGNHEIASFWASIRTRSLPNTGPREFTIFFACVNYNKSASAPPITFIWKGQLHIFGAFWTKSCKNSPTSFPMPVRLSAGKNPENCCQISTKVGMCS